MIIGLLISCTVAILSYAGTPLEVLNKTSKEIINKKPEELTKWFSLQPSTQDAIIHAKNIYYGKLIRVTGNPKPYALHNNLMQFRLNENVYAGLEIDSNTYLNFFNSSEYSFICKITKISNKNISVEECQIEFDLSK